MQAHKIVGKISEAERDQIKSLNSRKFSFESLFRSLMSAETDVKNKELYEKMMDDYSKTTLEFQAWWDTKSAEYGWENVPGGSWSVNFETCEIILNYLEV